MEVEAFLLNEVELLVTTDELAKGIPLYDLRLKLGSQVLLFFDVAGCLIDLTLEHAHGLHVAILLESINQLVNVINLGKSILHLLLDSRHLFLQGLHKVILVVSMVAVHVFTSLLDLSEDVANS